MAVVQSDIKVYLTGAASDGGAQTDPDSSFGNYRSSTEVGAGDNNLFDDITGSEASAGDTEYRCFCVKNTNGSDALDAVKVWISTDTGNAEDDISFAVEVPTSSDTAGYAQTIADESSAPTVNAGNVSDWSDATTKGTGVAININAHDTDLDAGEIIFVWLRRVISASASSASAESVTISVEGDVI